MERAFDTGEKKYACRLLVGNLKENIHLENHGVDVDLKEIVWLGFVWHSIGTYDELL